MAKKISKRPIKKGVKKNVKRSVRPGAEPAERGTPRKGASKQGAVKRPLRPPRKGSTFKQSLFNEDSGAGHRLQKILAVSGFGSRRQCEELIQQGRVEVDGQVAVLGTKVDPIKSEIKVDGDRLKRSKPIYLALFKPKGYLCTDSDQQGRNRVMDLIPREFGRLFLIGRLDMDSEGLILLTNDGAFSEQLTHPRYGVPKIYRVQVAGDVSQETVYKLKQGVYFSEGFAKAAEVVIRGRRKQSTILDITLTEGMNREIRRLLARMEHKVQTLIRIAVGPIKLGELGPGEWRQLTKEDVQRLYAMKPEKRKPKPKDTKKDY